MKIIAPLILLLIPVFCFAQFANEAGSLQESIKEYFEKTSIEKTKEAGQKMADAVSAMDEKQVRMLSSTLTEMHKKKMRLASHFTDFANNINIISNLPGSDQVLSGWLAVCLELLKRASVSKTKAFKNYINFTSQFFSDGSLSAVWRSESEHYELDFEEEPFIRFPQTTLNAQKRDNTISINNTSGTFFPLKNIWKGEGGRVDWGRNSGAYSNAWCELSTYDINTKKPEYRAHETVFHNEALFEMPIKGSLHDKLTRGEKGKYSYPRFTARKEVDFKKLAENIAIKGLFGLHGDKLIFSSDSLKHASVKITASDWNVKVQALSPKISVVDGNSILAKDAKTTLHLVQDSIYHPSLSFNFSLGNDQLKLFRENKTSSRVAFIDSYHKLEIDIEGLHWQLSDSLIRFKRLKKSVVNPVVVSSFDYYERALMQRVRKAVSKDPIYILKNWQESALSSEMPAIQLAQQINPGFGVDNVMNIIIDLVEAGFVFYDPLNQILTIRDKASNYFYAEKGQRDYDKIVFTSTLPDDNIQLDLNTLQLRINGVEQFELSGKKGVAILPYKQDLNAYENRGFETNGDLVAGNADFVDGTFTFDYNKFSIKIDSARNLLFYVPVEKDGSTEVLPIKTLVSDVSGELQVGDPSDMADKNPVADYPKFKSNEEAYIYYDSDNLFQGAYVREKFYFKIDPFEMNNFSTIRQEDINFSGTMVYGNIFPELYQTVRLQEDLTLGFVDNTTGNNTPTYGGRGIFNGTVNLSSQGLSAAGTIDFAAAQLKSDHFVFFPDSVSTKSGELKVKNTVIAGTGFPAVEGKDVWAQWQPYADSMLLRSPERFSLFNDKMSLEGDMLVSSEGLKSSGFIDCYNASLNAKLFSFDETSLYSDSTSFSITMEDSEKTYLRCNAGKVELNVDEEFALFRPLPDSLVTLPKHYYALDFEEIEWDYKRERVLFSGTDSGDLRSIHPKQNGISFKGSSALLNTADQVLEVEGIPEIRIADAAIIPGRGMAQISHDALIQPLEGANIIIDTLNRLHSITDASVEIFSKFDYTASGNYVYNGKGMAPQQIFFEKIESVKAPEPVKDVKKKKGQPTKVQSLYYSNARADVEEEKLFKLSPNMLFKGGVELSSQNKYMTFDGFAKIELAEGWLKPKWFAFKDEINPENIQLLLDKPVGEFRDSLYVGYIFSFDDYSFYTSFLDAKKTSADVNVFKTEGMLGYSAESQFYKIGQEKKINNEALKGDLFVLDQKQAKVNTVGSYRFGRNFGLVDVDIAGTSENNLKTGEYRFNDLILGLDFYLEDDLRAKIGRELNDLSIDNEEIDFLKESFAKSMVEFTDSVTSTTILNDVDRIGYFQNPKGFDHALLFTDLNMVWDTTNNSFRSVGSFGLAYVGDQYVNRKFDGYIEFIPRQRGDQFYVYLEVKDALTEQKDWMYFSFKNNVMQIISSNPGINSEIAGLKESKRKISNKDGLFFQFILGSAVKKNNFVYRLKENEEQYQIKEEKKRRF